MDIDRLTQLQACLDQLVTQFYSSLNHVNNAHDFVPLSDKDPKAVDTNVPQPTDEELTTNMQELARDLVLKTQQVDNLIDSLPGVQSTEQDQLDKLKALESELQQIEEERQVVLKDKEKLLDQCDDLILKVSREKVEIDQ